MKKVCFIAVFVCALLFQNQSIAQCFNLLDKFPTDISYCKQNEGSNPVVKVVYGRPEKKSNKVFGDQVPYGKLWRTGANEATEIKFYNDVEFGGKIVKSGTYIMHSIPGEDEWIIILNSNLDTWGSHFYDKSKDVVRISVPTKSNGLEEVFSIVFEQDLHNSIMVLAWDKTRVDIPLKIKENLTAKI